MFTLIKNQMMWFLWSPIVRRSSVESILYKKDWLLDYWGFAHFFSSWKFFILNFTYFGHSETSDLYVKKLIAYPIYHGCCSCKSCMHVGAEDSGFEVCFPLQQILYLEPVNVVICSFPYNRFFIITSRFTSH